MLEPTEDEQHGQRSDDSDFDIADETDVSDDESGADEVHISIEVSPEPCIGEPDESDAEQNMAG